jgi:serine/threonine protein kinase
VSKLSDVGLATMLPGFSPGGNGALASQLSTRIVGTPLYLDPDYLRTGRVSASSDVYALGIILMQLLTGLSVTPGEVEEALDTGGLAGILDSSAGTWPVQDAEKVIE